MSDPKDFLSRWSQRKLNPPAEKPAPAEKQASLPEAGNAAETASSVPQFDVSTLPPLESINAESDIRAFLQRGVPAALSREALRRAWSADPAIRDFVGLAENSWDFNAANPFLGFGPLDAEDVKTVAARYFGQLADEADGKTAETGPIDSESAPEPVRTARQETSPESPVEPGDAPQTHAALQQGEGGELQDAEPAPRRHGSALPK